MLPVVRKGTELRRTLEPRPPFPGGLRHALRGGQSVYQAGRRALSSPGGGAESAGYSNYGPGDLWGCVGQWYSGGWYDSGATSYIATVQNNLSDEVWLGKDF